MLFNVLSNNRNWSTTEAAGKIIKRPQRIAIFSAALLIFLNSKKGGKGSFWYPQDCKIEQGNNLLFCQKSVGGVIATTVKLWTRLIT